MTTHPLESWFPQIKMRHIPTAPFLISVAWAGIDNFNDDSLVRVIARVLTVQINRAISGYCLKKTQIERKLGLKGVSFGSQRCFLWGPLMHANLCIACLLLGYQIHKKWTISSWLSLGRMTTLFKLQVLPTWMPLHLISKQRPQLPGYSGITSGMAATASSPNLYGSNLP